MNFNRYFLWFWLAVWLVSAGTGFSQSTGDYRTATGASGDWSTLTNWEIWNGSEWVAASAAPTSANAAIRVRSDASLTISANLSVDQLTIDGSVVLTGHSTLTIANGTEATDLTVNGVFINQTSSGGISRSSSAKWSLAGGSTYIHETTTSASDLFSSVTLFTLDPASTFVYRRTSANPSMSFSGRTYGNLKFEAASGSYSFSSGSGSSTLTVLGNLTIGPNVSGDFNSFSGDFSIAGNVTVEGSLLNSSSFTVGASKALNVSSGSSLTIKPLKTITIEGAMNVPATASIGGSGTINFAGTTATVTGSFTGGLALVKSNATTLNLNAANSMTGKTTVVDGTLAANTDLALGQITELEVSGGTLLFGGSGNRINDLAGVLLSGGEIDTAGLDETLGVLTLTANSTIDLGSGTSGLSFANSSAASWSSGVTLSIQNWTSGSDVLKFGSTSGGVSGSQLSQISFVNPSGFDPGTYGATIDSLGVVTPVPEPATVLAALCLIGFAGWWERRRWMPLVAKAMRQFEAQPWAQPFVRIVTLCSLGLLVLGVILMVP